MRISAIHVEGFGVFADELLQALPPGLTVILGENEAGKSTLLAFLRAVLFGFADGRSKDNQYGPLRGGRHGGRLTLRSGDGAEHIVERWTGPRGGPVTVSSANATVGGEESLRELLGGTTRELFRNVYAFSLSELQSFETLQGDAVKAALYGASAGASVLALPRVQAEVESRLGEIFKPAGSKPMLNARLQEFEQVRGNLREALGTIDRYQQLQASIRQLTAEVETEQTDLRALSQCHRECEKLLNLWGPWTRLRQAGEELARLPAEAETPFPANGVERLELALERALERRKTSSEATREVQERGDLLRALEVDESLVRCTDPVAGLRDGAKVYEDRGLRIAQARDAARELERELRSLLGELGEGWDVDRIRRMDRSLFTRDQIRKHAAAVDETRRQRQNLEADAKARGEALRNATRNEQEQHTRLEALPVAEEYPADLVAALLRGREYIARVVNELPALEAKLDGQRAELDRALASIGNEWTAEKVLGFDLSADMQARVEGHERSLDGCRSEVAREKSLLAASERTLESELMKVENARQALDTIGPDAGRSREDLFARRGRLRKFRESRQGVKECEAEWGRSVERLSDWRREAARVERGGEGLDLRALGLAGWGLIALAAVALAFLLAMNENVIGAVAAVLLSAVGVLLLVARRSSESRSREAAKSGERAHRVLLGEIEQLEAEAADLESRLQNRRRELELEASELGVSAAASAHDIDQEDSLAEAQIVDLDRRVGLTRDLQAARDSQTAAATAREQISKQVDASSRQLAAVEQNWARELAGLGFSDTASPRTVAAILVPRIQAARRSIQKMREDEGQAVQFRRVLKDYGEQASVVTRLGASLSAGPAEFLAALDGFLNDADAADRASQARTVAVSALERETKNREEAQRRMEEAERVRVDASMDGRRAEDEWAAWLKSHGLAPGLSEATALDALQRIGQVVETADRLATWNGDLCVLEEQQKSYADAAEHVLSELGRETPGPTALPEAVKRLSVECDTAVSEAKRKVALEREVKTAQERAEAGCRLLEEAEVEIQELIASAGVDDEESFRRLGSEEAQRVAVREKIANLRQTLAGISGETDLSALCERLAALTIEDLETEKSTLEKKIETTDGLIEAKRERRAQHQQESSVMASSDDVSRSRGDEERLRAEIGQLALKWGRYAVARHVMEEAKQRFERERQPRVLLDASRYFSVITDGRYVEVRSNLGARDGAIEIVSKTGERFRAEALSRGTQEQLYLALRFGYIVNHRSNEEPLPVVMDDIIVNFDPRRASRAARAIFELAKDYQVLFFTCHPWVLDAFRQEDANVPCFRLENGAFK